MTVFSSGKIRIRRYNVIPAPEKRIPPRRALPVPMRRFTSRLNARPSQTSRLERRATLKHLQNRARYCKITRGLEAYRSGHNEPHSKCGDGQPSASSNLAASAKAKKAPWHGCFFAFSEARCGTLRLAATLPKNGCFLHSICTKSTNGRKVRRLAGQDACGFSIRTKELRAFPKRTAGHRPSLMPHTSPLP